MEPLEWVLAFVNNISTPARQMTGSVVTLTKALKELQGVADKLKPINLPGINVKGGGVAKASSDMAKFANMWTKIGARMQKDQTAALKAAEPGVSKEFANMWGRIGQRMASDQTKAMNKAAKDAQRASAAAAHKPYFGGHKSLGNLFAARAEHKTSGLATGAADAILGAPGRILSGAVGAIGSIIEGTTTMAYNFGKAAISAQAMREDSVSGFTAVFGNAEEANRLFDAARTAAKQTKFDTGDVVRDFNTIAAAGFKAQQVERIYWTSADVGSARGAGRQQRYLNALSKINASPQASFGAVQQAALAGPGIGNVFESLKARTGGKDRTRKEWMKEFASGAISGTTALEAVIDATNKLYNKTTGIPGEYAKALGDKSWAGTISNIKNGLGDILNMRLPDDHPMNKFKSVLQAIGSSGGLFDSTSKRGKEFESIISDMVADLFELFGIDTKDLPTAMDGILTISRKIEENFKKFTKYVRTEVYPAVSSAIEELSSGKLDDTLGKFAAKIGWVVAKGVVTGIFNGIMSSGAQIPHNNTGGWTVVTSGDLDKTTKTAQPTGLLQSDELPSYDIGGRVSGGYGQPQLAIVHGGEYVIPNGATAGASGTRGGLGQMPAVHVHVHGSLGMDEDDLRLAVQQGTFSGIVQALEESAASQGAIGAA